jgi:hypothetical protein
MREVCYLRGEHGAALNPDNIPSIVEFVKGEDQRSAPAPWVCDQSAAVLWLSRFCWLVWLVLVAAVIAGAFLFNATTLRIFNLLCTRLGVPPAGPLWITWPVYVIIALILLFSV